MPTLPPNTVPAHQRVVSSAMESVGYDHGALIVHWKSGNRSVHPGVPVEVYSNLLRAPSKGKCFAKNIRPKYPAK